MSDEITPITIELMISELSEMAQNFEAQGAPGHLVMAIWEAADDFERLAHNGGSEFEMSEPDWEGFLQSLLQSNLEIPGSTD